MHSDRTLSTPIANPRADPYKPHEQSKRAQSRWRSETVYTQLGVVLPSRLRTQALPQTSIVPQKRRTTTGVVMSTLKKAPQSPLCLRDAIKGDIHSGKRDTRLKSLL
jgi:hypothetical protein